MEREVKELKDEIEVERQEVKDKLRHAAELSKMYHLSPYKTMTCPRTRYH